MSDVSHIVITGSIFLAHAALVALSVYGVWYEYKHWDGGVAFAYLLAGLLGAYGVWRSVEAMVNRTWKAVSVLAVTVPGVSLLIGVLPLLMWSRSGP